jgi:zinc transport system ATP-binding protein
MMNVLEVEHLVIRLGTTVIVRDLSFNVRRGSTVAVIGPNGAGKTVLFRALIGALPYEGIVRWAPEGKLGYVPQKLDIERDLPITGGDLLRAKSRLVHVDQDAVHRALTRVGLSPDILRLSIGTLSGGQFQRLLVAFALLGDPTVLLLDEPAAGVDAPGQEQLYESVHQLQMETGMTIIFISHDLSVVYRYAVNVLCLSRSQRCFGAPQTVLTPEALNQLYSMPIGLHVHDGP